MSRSKELGEKGLVVNMNQGAASFGSVFDSLIDLRVHGDCDTFVSPIQGGGNVYY